MTFKKPTKKQIIIACAILLAVIIVSIVVASIIERHKYDKYDAVYCSAYKTNGILIYAEEIKRDGDFFIVRNGDKYYYCPCEATVLFQRGE